MYRQVRAALAAKGDAWWAKWLAKWDAMQAAYVPHRAERFRLMAEILAERFPIRCRVMDIGAGTGTLAEEILNRVPGSTVLCLDVEPFLLTAAQRRLRQFGKRATIAPCDFRRQPFTTEITEGTEGKLEAVVSSTTLHWFSEERLAAIYTWASSMLVQGGLLLNADHIQPNDPEIARLALDLNEAERACLFQETGAVTWDEFWDGLGQSLGQALTASPSAALGQALGTSAALGASPRADYLDTVAQPAWGEQDGPETGFPFSVHERLLRQAGFRHIAILWRHLSDALLIATR